MMNGRHLPAGQGIPNGRRPYNQQQYQPAATLYNGYMGHYNSFYPQVPPPYQHAGIPPVPYVPYQAYGRSPPPQFQQYTPTPPPVVSSYPRPQASPSVVATPYQPPQQTNASPHSSHILPGPLSPPKAQIQEVNIPRSPFQPPLPWLSRPDLQWPSKTARNRRKRKPPQSSEESVELPSIQGAQSAQAPSETTQTATPTAARPETPSTAQAPSEEAVSTTPTTPASTPQTSNIPTISSASTLSKPLPKQTVPVPIIPIIPKSISRASSGTLASQKASEESLVLPAAEGSTAIALTCGGDEIGVADKEAKPVSPTAKGAPILWTGLFKAPAITPTPSVNGAQSKAANSSVTGSFSQTNSESFAEALRSFSATTRDVKLGFLEPRGLVNTGNMCYMNSVLQVLIFCVPFHNFLDQVGRRAAHSFKSDTHLIDAMIMFMHEFNVIDSAASMDQLRMRLKANELEQYGESFTPDFVYDVINKLPKFSSLRRGHQQDAEEFLGFLLSGLHDECVQVMQSAGSSARASRIATPAIVPSSPVSDTASLADSTVGENGWLEVGPKQKAAVTRSSGTILIESPVTKIFGGTLRSELRVPGLKNSVTVEPYQPLQLDIGSPTINNIVDALKGLTRPETLHGDFKSPRGPNVTATKQVLIETLPPVLILHLKRFQYDNTGGTQKIWKKIGYPLELEIPKEVFSRQKHSSILNHGGLPRYRLIAVVYHHGKNASGGHYTVDVRRQDGQEWIRLDDTVIRRVRSEDVADGGSEEDPKVLAAAIEAHQKDTLTSGNIFAPMRIGDDEETGDDDGWKQVNSSTSAANGTGKKWSSVVDGTATPKSKGAKSSIKDNKVAYLLFYQKIGI